MEGTNQEENLVEYPSGNSAAADIGERQYLLVQLRGESGEAAVLRPGMGYKFSGLDTHTPVLRLEDGSVWAGEYEDIMGSAMVFGEGGGRESMAGLHGSTQLKLVFRRQASSHSQAAQNDGADGGGETT